MMAHIKNVQTGEEFLGHLESSRPIRFVEQPDLVIVCGCAQAFGSRHAFQGAQGRDSMTGWVTPQQSFFEWVFTRYPAVSERPRRVMVVPECCGPYSAGFQDELRNMFPQVTWMFPRVPSMMCGASEESLIKHLIDHKVLTYER